MNPNHTRRPARVLWSYAALLLACATPALAHPLGNFTINRFARVEVDATQIRVRYVVDMAEIPTFQAFQTITPDGSEPPPSQLAEYAERRGLDYAAGLQVTAAGAPVSLTTRHSQAVVGHPNGGVATLRLEYELDAADVEANGRLRFADGNEVDRLGWREIVVASGEGVQLYDSTAFGNSASDELRSYPRDLLTAPLDERVVEMSATTHALPAAAVGLRSRDGRSLTPPAHDRFVDLIAQRELTAPAILLALLIAALLGAMHAMSPGHGKTVVGAYLVGSRGTAKHAVFLGLTVTVTHTLGVFALGLVTLFASSYVLPEQLFPVLSLLSGAIVLAMGLGLLVTRTRAAFGHTHSHHQHQDATPTAHQHSGHEHEHGHSHLPPEGTQMTWRTLLALGISGGIVPCPSALVVLLAAVALHRIAFGLLLIVAFSAGLAGALTLVGLAFVYAGRWVKRPAVEGAWLRVLPLLSALVITAVGAVLCYRALLGIGVNGGAALPAIAGGWLSSLSALGIGLVFGLKHALDADHLAAVSTIVSERKTRFGAACAGIVWGIGHTMALLAAGLAVIFLHVEIGARTAQGLELIVAVMLVGLGAQALWKVARGGHLHVHAHGHGVRAHLHAHAHATQQEPHAQTHHGLRFNVRPLVIGMVHGLAGSAALMLLVLTTIPSPLFGLAYIAVFGVGSIGGMMLMSLLVALPLQLSASRFARADATVRTLAALFSLALGLSMAVEIGGGLMV